MRRNALNQMYLSFLRPILEYACTVWDNCNHFEKQVYFGNTVSSNDEKIMHIHIILFIYPCCAMLNNMKTSYIGQVVLKVLKDPPHPYPWLFVQQLPLFAVH